jgi:hypothetical protein
MAVRACGVVFRFGDEANYHAARLDAADGQLVVAVMSHGRERILGRQVVAAPGVWQELALEARAGRIRLSLNGSTTLEVTDGAPDGAPIAAGRGRPMGSVGRRDVLRRADRRPAARECAGFRAAASARPKPELIILVAPAGSRC